MSPGGSTTAGEAAERQHPMRGWRNRQTRWIQVPVPARAWGFNSPLAHRGDGSPPDESPGGGPFLMCGRSHVSGGGRAHAVSRTGAPRVCRRRRRPVSWDGLPTFRAAVAGVLPAPRPSDRVRPGAGPTCRPGLDGSRVPLRGPRDTPSLVNAPVPLRFPSRAGHRFRPSGRTRGPVRLDRPARARAPAREPSARHRWRGRRHRLGRGPAEACRVPGNGRGVLRAGAGAHPCAGVPLPRAGRAVPRGGLPGHRSSAGSAGAQRAAPPRGERAARRAARRVLRDRPPWWAPGRRDPVRAQVGDVSGVFHRAVSTEGDGPCRATVRSGHSSVGTAADGGRRPRTGEAAA